MFWLLACTPPPPVIELPPAIELSVAPPTAVNATAVPADTFVGPLDIADLDAATLCGAPDRAALLRAGRFGWRVLVLGPGVLRPFDEVAPPDDTADTARVALVERLYQWAAADKLASERCGASVTTPVLLAVDGGSPYEATALGVELARFDTRLLVRDPTPGPPVPAAVRTEESYSLTLVASSGGWAVLPNRQDIPATEHLAVPSDPGAAARAAAERVVQAGYPAVVLVAGGPWSRVVEGMDALAGIGVVPTFGLWISGDPAPPWPAPTGSTRITLGETLAVLRYEPAGYVERKGKDGKRPMILQMIGTNGKPDAPGPSSLPDVFGPAPEEPARGPVR